MNSAARGAELAHLLTMYGFLAYVITAAIMVFFYPTPATPAPAILPLLWYPRGPYGLLRRLLVLVLHPGRCRRRGQFTVPHCPRRPVHPFASRERDAGPHLGVPAGDGRLVDKCVPRFVPHRHDSALRIRSVVQVLAYVLQARRGLPETGRRSERFEEQPAGPGRQTRNIRRASSASLDITDPPTLVFDTGANGRSCRHLST